MRLNGGCLRFWANPILLHSDLQANMWLDRLTQAGRFASLHRSLLSHAWSPLSPFPTAVFLSSLVFSVFHLGVFSFPSSFDFFLHFSIRPSLFLLTTGLFFSYFHSFPSLISSLPLFLFYSLFFSLSFSSTFFSSLVFLFSSFSPPTRSSLAGLNLSSPWASRHNACGI